MGLFVISAFGRWTGVRSLSASALFIGALLIAPGGLRAQNLVQDPSFEATSGNTDCGECGQDSNATNPFWTLGTGGDTSFAFAPAGGDAPEDQARTGNWYVSFGSVSPDQAQSSALSQVISTTPLTTYLISFFLANDSGPTNNFQVFFDGQAVLPTGTILNANAFPYTQFSGTVTTGAQSTQSTLQFVGEQDPGFFALDDISVQQDGAPAPTVGGGIASFVLAIAGLAFYRLRGKRAA